MRSFVLASQLATAVLAFEPFLEFPDTGLQSYLQNQSYTEGTLPDLKDMRGVLDFEFAGKLY